MAKKTKKYNDVKVFFKNLKSHIVTYWLQCVRVFKLPLVILILIAASIGLLKLLIVIFKGDDINYEILAQVIQAMSWPFVVLVLGFTFKKNIIEIMKNIESIKGPGGTEAVFTQAPPKESNAPESIDVAVSEVQENNEREDSEDAGSEVKYEYNVDSQLADDKTDEYLRSSKGCLEFERIYRIMYGTQLELLEQLGAPPLGRHRKDSLLRFYEKHENSLPGSKLDDFGVFIGYLISANLVLSHGDTDEYELTIGGYYFLAYVKSERLKIFNTRKF